MSHSKKVTEIILESMKTIFKSKVSDKFLVPGVMILGLHLDLSDEYLDSLDLVELVSRIELKLLQELGVKINLVSEELLNQGMSVFDTENTLSAYILSFI